MRKSSVSLDPLVNLICAYFLANYLTDWPWWVCCLTALLVAGMTPRGVRVNG